MSGQITAATAFSQLALPNFTVDSGPAVLVLLGPNTVTLEHLTVNDMSGADFGF